MKKHLILVGGGHAHLTAILRGNDYIKRGHSVTLISPSPYHYYSGMGPGMLSGIYRPQDIRFNIKKMSEDRGATFLQDAVTGFNPKERVLFLRSGRNIGYDVVSFNTGSEISSEKIDVTGKGIYMVKPIENLIKARDDILGFKNSRMNITVVGGGPGGIELAGNTWRLVKDNKLNVKITLVSSGGLLDNFPQRAQSLVRASLKSRGIELIERAYFKGKKDETALLENRGSLSSHLVLLATGVKPSSFLRESDVKVGEDGGLLVNSFLQHPSHPEIFGGGDCISFQGYPLAKAGVYAVRENSILYHNIFVALEGGTLKQFKPQRSFMLIFNMGDGRGILVRNKLVLSGRYIFSLKNFIDRGFMRKFQVSGELREA